jgi:hypothetical protein
VDASKNNFEVCGYTLSLDAETTQKEAENKDISEGFIDTLVVMGIVIVIMVKIQSVLKNVTPQYIDGLDSYKLYKRSFINEAHEKTWAILLSLM